MRHFLFSLVVALRDRLAWLEWKLHPWSAPPARFLNVFEGPQIVVRVQEMNSAGSHYLEVNQVLANGSWSRVGVIDSAYVWQVVDLLQQAASSVGPRRLPIVELEGEKWFFDGRLHQLRSVRTPVQFLEVAFV
jgi:hypothetical protein